MNLSKLRLGVVGVACAMVVGVGNGATPQATYFFNDNLSAQEKGAPSLVAHDPLALSHFEPAIVYGEVRRVYHYVGDPVDQAGLSVDTAGLIPADDYSIEIVFEFVESETRNGWRKIMDSHFIAPDDNGAIFIDDAGRLDLYVDEVGHPGPTPFTENEFHHVVLTYMNGIASIYLDGNPEQTVNTRDSEIDSPLGFFLDNGDEYADGRVALIRLYDGVLRDSQVALLATNPFLGLCFADLDGDGTVDFTDILILLAVWGPCEAGCLGADLDGNGVVDIGDLLAVLAAWGPCPE